MKAPPGPPFWEQASRTQRRPDKCSRTFLALLGVSESPKWHCPWLPGLARCETRHPWVPLLLRKNRKNTVAKLGQHLVSCPLRAGVKLCEKVDCTLMMKSRE